MNWHLQRGFLALISIGLAVITIGCDEPNDPDRLPQPYRMAAVYPTNGTAEHVVVRDTLVAIADGSHGAVVMAGNSPTTLRPIFRYPASPQARCRYVALDTEHHYLAAYADPAESFLRNVFDYRVSDPQLAQVEITIALGAPLGDFELTVKRDAVTQNDTLIFWGTDLTTSDGFITSTVKCRSGDSSRWQSCSWGVPPFIPKNGLPRGFDIRDDGVIALATDDAGLTLLSTAPFDTLATRDTPGIAYDCAWFNANHIAVADEYGLVLFDASVLTNPVHLVTLTMPGADRLRRIVVDGLYACVMDIYDGVYVVDVSNPRSPRYVQFLELLDPTSVAAKSGQLYVTDQNAGLVIYTR